MSAIVRGGYHLLPLFVMVVAVALAFLEKALGSAIGHPRLAGLAAGIVLAVLLDEPLAAVAGNYATQAAEVFDRPSAVSITRTLPAEWMARTFPRGTRVATILSRDPAFVPPIRDLGFVFDDSLLLPGADQIPVTFEPPSVDDLRSRADVFVVTDWQLTELLWKLSSGGRRDAAARWQQWFEMMRRGVPSVVFSAPTRGYYYRSVEIFVLDQATSAATLRASVTSTQSPVTVRIPLDRDVQ